MDDKFINFVEFCQKNYNINKAEIQQETMADIKNETDELFLNIFGLNN